MIRRPEVGQSVILVSFSQAATTTTAAETLVVVVFVIVVLVFYFSFVVVVENAEEAVALLLITDLHSLSCFRFFCCYLWLSTLNLVIRHHGPLTTISRSWWVIRLSLILLSTSVFPRCCFDHDQQRNCSESDCLSTEEFCTFLLLLLVVGLCKSSSSFCDQRVLLSVVWRRN